MSDNKKQYISDTFVACKVSTVQEYDQRLKWDKKHNTQKEHETHSFSNDYLFVGIECDLSYYDNPQLSGETYSYNNQRKMELIKALKPTTKWMTMSIFKVISSTPERKEGGFFTAPKIIPPSLLVETMDGRKIEGYDCTVHTFQYPTDDDCGSYYNALLLSKDVLNEVNKNFIHPRLSLNNYNKYTPRSPFSNFKGSGYKPVIRRYDKNQVAELYGQWNDGKESLKRHFDRLFEEQDIAAQKANQIAKEKAERTNADKKRHIDDFDRAFSKKPSEFAQSNSIHSCPFCATKCRVPNNGKRIAIKCPKCNKEFTVRS